MINFKVWSLSKNFVNPVTHFFLQNTHANKKKIKINNKDSVFIPESLNHISTMTYPIKVSPYLAVSRKIPTKDVNNKTTCSMKAKIMDRRRKLRVKSYSFLKKSKGSLEESKKDQRSVSFASKSEEFYTLPLVEYTDGEFSSCFFNDEEYDSMSMECCKIIQRLEMGKKISEKSIALGDLRK